MLFRSTGPGELSQELNDGKEGRREFGLDGAGTAKGKG